MARPSTHWSVRLSDDWWRLTSLRGLFAGIVASALNLVGFLLVFALFIRSGGKVPIEWARPSDAAFWTSILASFASGFGYVNLARIDSVRRGWQTVAGRIATLVLLYGGYALLFSIVPALTFFAGFGFVGGRILGHLWIFTVARL